MEERKDSMIRLHESLPGVATGDPRWLRSVADTKGWKGGAMLNLP